ncbi:DMT family transporter [Burkholderia stagnalis]|uniref:DMT family transporter n=1 Tax=Burkholderia stagnalis TaxID=1503054 RepID=UPI000F55D6D6|nr:DMT family transporter [Burkholderia stagnalis]RQQ01992.1 DMT family transporter [Burkholderia stagnalis]RQQ09766.1 DMT family transporter [Burkholderia stagnalis]RQQ24938.1 DMT family transporter [Burkholderia stagnalis]RQQ26735.1 DMT family transporter [Burkholderia stagnalis]RQQ27299.1 DMT family transporter [Burkholderia stagnalis]
MLTSIVAAAFVALWSTGFIVARAIKPYADPNLFLLARFAGTAVLFGAVALAARAPWPARREWPRHLIAGALLQGVYLGASYWAVAQGLNAGVMALLGALQPLATAVLAVPLFNERLSARGWLGMALGLVGVALVLAPKVAGGVAPAWLVVAVSVLSVGAITAGSLYQKGKLAQSDLRTAVAVQNLGAALVAAVFAVLLHETRWSGSPALWVSLVWGVVFLSGGAVTMLMWMLRRGNAARATSLLFLAPPLAALQGYLMFGETLAAIQLAGFAVALAGVVLARR